MSGSLNKVQLIGNLGRDPEIRHTQGGGRIASLSIATSETWRDRDSGERRERTEWHRIVIFNEQLAEVAEKFLRKGAKVYLEGQLATRKWTDNGGVERYTTEVVLPRFNARLVLLDRREGGPPPAEGPEAYGTERPHGDAARPKAAGALDDDIPF